MPWTCDILPLAGGSPLVTATPFKSGRVTWSLDGQGAAEVNLRPTDVADGRWLYGQRRIRFKDSGGTPRFQGWLDALQRFGPPGAPEYLASSRTLAAALDEAVVHGDFSKTVVADSTIAWDLIAHAQAQTGNIWNFTQGTPSGSAVNRSRYFCDGDNIGEQIRELAEMSDGFDWEVDAAGVFQVWNTGRGTDQSGSRIISPNVSTDWECDADTYELRTVVTALGDDDDSNPCGPPLVIEVDSAKRTTYGLRETTIESETLDAGELERKAEEELRSRVASRLNIRNTWIEGRGPWAFGAVWLGDLVQAQPGPEFGGNINVRLISVTLTFEDKYEFVEMEWEAAT